VEELVLVHVVDERDVRRHGRRAISAGAGGGASSKHDLVAVLVDELGRLRAHDRLDRVRWGLASVPGGARL
jgi:hypothetical protein